MKDKKIFFRILLFFYSIYPLVSFTQDNSEWVISAGTNGLDIVNDMGIDSGGNIIMIGSLGVIQSNKKTCFEGAGFRNFISKYDSSGKLIWINQLYGSTLGYARNIKLLSKDQIIVSGNQSNVEKSGGTVYKTQEYFLSCLNGNGNEIWSKNFPDHRLTFLIH